jgi:hypothetical protein
VALHTQVADNPEAPICREFAFAKARTQPRTVKDAHYDALKRRGAGRALARLELRLEQPPVGLVADPKQRLPGQVIPP